MDAKVHHAIAALKDALKPFDFVLCIQDESRQRYWSCSGEGVKEDLEHKGGVILSDVDIMLEDEKERRTSSKVEGRRAPSMPLPAVGAGPSSADWRHRHGRADGGYDDDGGVGGSGGHLRGPALPPSSFTGLSGQRKLNVTSVVASASGTYEPYSSSASSASLLKDGQSGESINGDYVGASLCENMIGENRDTKIHNDRSHEDRSRGAKSHDNRSHESRSHDAHSHNTQSHGARSVGARSQGTRSQGTRSQGARSQGARSQGARSQGARSQGARSQSTRSHCANSQDASNHDNGSQNTRSQDNKSHDKSRDNSSHNKSHLNEANNNKSHDKTSHNEGLDKKSYDKKGHDNRSRENESHNKSLDNKSHNKNDNRSRDNRSSDNRSRDNRSRDNRSHDSRSHDNRIHDNRSHDNRSHDNRGRDNSHENHKIHERTGQGNADHDDRSHDDKTPELRRNESSENHTNNDIQGNSTNNWTSSFKGDDGFGNGSCSRKNGGVGSDGNDGRSNYKSSRSSSSSGGKSCSSQSGSNVRSSINDGSRIAADRVDNRSGKRLDSSGNKRVDGGNRADHGSDLKDYNDGGSQSGNDFAVTRNPSRSSPTERIRSLAAAPSTSRCLLLQNIDADLREEPLRYLLEECGRVERLRYDGGKNGDAGVARVQFSRIDDAARAFAKLDGLKLGRRLSIRVKYRATFEDEDVVAAAAAAKADVDEDCRDEKDARAKNDRSEIVEGREARSAKERQGGKTCDESSKSNYGDNERRSDTDDNRRQNRGKKSADNGHVSSDNDHDENVRSSGRYHLEDDKRRENEKARSQVDDDDVSNNGEEVFKKPAGYRYHNKDPKGVDNGNREGNCRRRRSEGSVSVGSGTYAEERFSPSAGFASSRNAEEDDSDGEPDHRRDRSPRRGAEKVHLPARKPDKFLNSFKPVAGNDATAAVELNVRKALASSAEEGRRVSSSAAEAETELSIEICSTKVNSSPSLSLRFSKDEMDVDLTDYEDYADEEERGVGHRHRRTSVCEDVDQLDFVGGEKSVVKEPRMSVSDVEQLDNGEFDEENSDDDDDDDDSGRSSSSATAPPGAETQGTASPMTRGRISNSKARQSFRSSKEASEDHSSTSRKKEETQSSSRLSRRSSFEEARASTTKNTTTRSSAATISGDAATKAATSAVDRAKGAARTSASSSSLAAWRERRKELPKAYADVIEDRHEVEAERKWGKLETSGGSGGRFGGRRRERRGRNEVCLLLRRRRRPPPGRSRSGRGKSSFSNDRSSSCRRCFDKSDAVNASHSERGNGSGENNNNYNVNGSHNDGNDGDVVGGSKRLLRALSAESVMDPRNRPTSVVHTHYNHYGQRHDRRRSRHPRHSPNSGRGEADALGGGGGGGVVVRKHCKDDACAMRRICVMNIDPSALECDFMGLVAQYGVVEDVQVVRVSEFTPRSRATVQYARAGQAMRARGGILGQVFGRYTLYTCMGNAQPYLFHTDDPQLPMVPIVYVKGLRTEVEPRFIRGAFGKFGAIDEIRRGANPPNGRPVPVKGVFILYQELESAVDACLHMDGCVFPGWESAGAIYVSLFHSTRAREANTGISLVREFRNKKKGVEEVVKRDVEEGQKNRQQLRIAPPTPGVQPPSSFHQKPEQQQPQQQQTQQRPQQPSNCHVSVPHEKQDSSRYPRRHSHDPPSRNHLAPPTHQRFHPYRRAKAALSTPPRNKDDGGDDKDFRPRRRLHPLRRTSRGVRGGRGSKDPALKSASSAVTRGALPMDLNEGVPNDVTILVELKDKVPRLCDAVFTHEKNVHPSSLHLLHGDPLFVESVLSCLKTTPGGVKIFPLSNVSPLDDDSLLALSVKMCLRTLPNTALLMAFRKEDVVGVGESLGHWRPLRYAVEHLKAKSMAASFEIDATVAVDGQGGGAATTKLVVYVAPASRFSQLLKRSIPTLDKQIMKDNSTHLVIIALPKDYDQLKWQSNKTALTTF